MIGGLPEELEFFKMAGAGNDFVLIDNRRGSLREEDLPELAKKLCRRGLSIGADGLIMLGASARASVRMVYLNADGSRGELCGNGSRCAARLAYMRVMAGKKLTLETDSGILRAEVLDEGAVRVQMPQPADAVENIEIDIGEKQFTCQFVKVGVPHVVIYTQDVDKVPVHLWGKRVRGHARLASEGANVHFVQRVGAGWRQRSYERGVEAETYACGSGAVATAYFGARLFGMKSPAPVAVRSGALLTVHYELDSRGEPFQFDLEGETRLICRGKITPEALWGARAGEE